MADIFGALKKRLGGKKEKEPDLALDRLTLDALAALKAKLSSDPGADHTTEFSTIVKDFFHKLLKIKYHFTYEELINEISRRRFTPEIKKEMTDYIKALIHLEFSPGKTIQKQLPLQIDTFGALVVKAASETAKLPKPQTGKKQEKASAKPAKMQPQPSKQPQPIQSKLAKPPQQPPLPKQSPPLPPSQKQPQSPKQIATSVQAQPSKQPLPKKQISSPAVEAIPEIPVPPDLKQETIKSETPKPETAKQAPAPEPSHHKITLPTFSLFGRREKPSEKQPDPEPELKLPEIKAPEVPVPKSAGSTQPIDAKQPLTKKPQITPKNISPIPLQKNTLSGKAGEKLVGRQADIYHLFNRAYDSVQNNRLTDATNTLAKIKVLNSKLDKKGKARFKDEIMHLSDEIAFMKKDLADKSKKEKAKRKAGAPEEPLPQKELKFSQPMAPPPLSFDEEGVPIAPATPTLQQEHTGPVPKQKSPSIFSLFSRKEKSPEKQPEKNLMAELELEPPVFETPNPAQAPKNLEPPSLKATKAELDKIKPSAAKPEAVKPELLKPGAVKPELPKPEAAKPEPAKQEAIKPLPVPAPVSVKVAMPTFSLFGRREKPSEKQPAPELGLVSDKEEIQAPPLPPLTTPTPVQPLKPQAAQPLKPQPTQLPKPQAAQPLKPQPTQLPKPQPAQPQQIQSKLAKQLAPEKSAQPTVKPLLAPDIKSIPVPPAPPAPPAPPKIEELLKPKTGAVKLETSLLAVKPLAAKPLAAKPLAVKAESTKPASAKPALIKPEIAKKPEPVKPESVKPEPLKPLILKPSAPKPSTVKPAPAKAATPKPGPVAPLPVPEPLPPKAPAPRAPTPFFSLFSRKEKPSEKQPIAEMEKELKPAVPAQAKPKAEEPPEDLKYMPKRKQDEWITKIESLFANANDSIQNKRHGDAEETLAQIKVVSSKLDKSDQAKFRFKIQQLNKDIILLKNGLPGSSAKAGAKKESVAEPAPLLQKPAPSKISPAPSPALSPAPSKAMPAQSPKSENKKIAKAGKSAKPSGELSAKPEKSVFSEPAETLSSKPAPAMGQRDSIQMPAPPPLEFGKLEELGLPEIGTHLSSQEAQAKPESKGGLFSIFRKKEPIAKEMRSPPQESAPAPLIETITPKEIIKEQPNKAADRLSEIYTLFNCAYDSLKNKDVDDAKNILEKIIRINTKLDKKDQANFREEITQLNKEIDLLKKKLAEKPKPAKGKMEELLEPYDLPIPPAPSPDEIKKLKSGQEPLEAISPGIFSPHAVPALAEADMPMSEIKKSSKAAISPLKPLPSLKLPKSKAPASKIEQSPAFTLFPAKEAEKKAASKEVAEMPVAAEIPGKGKMPGVAEIPGKGKMPGVLEIPGIDEIEQIPEAGKVDVLKHAIKKKPSIEPAAALKQPEPVLAQSAQKPAIPTKAEKPKQPSLPKAEKLGIFAPAEKPKPSIPEKMPQSQLQAQAPKPLTLEDMPEPPAPEEISGPKAPEQPLKSPALEPTPKSPLAEQLLKSPITEMPEPPTPEQMPYPRKFTFISQADIHQEVVHEPVILENPDFGKLSLEEVHETSPLVEKVHEETMALEKPAAKGKSGQSIFRHLVEKMAQPKTQPATPAAPAEPELAFPPELEETPPLRQEPFLEKKMPILEEPILKEIPLFEKGPALEEMPILKEEPAIKEKPILEQQKQISEKELTKEPATAQAKEQESISETDKELLTQITVLIRQMKKALGSKDITTADMIWEEITTTRLAISEELNEATEPIVKEIGSALETLKDDESKLSTAHLAPVSDEIYPEEQPVQDHNDVIFRIIRNRPEYAEHLESPPPQDTGAQISNPFSESIPEPEPIDFAIRREPETKHISPSISVFYNLMDQARASLEESRIDDAWAVYHQALMLKRRMPIGETEKNRLTYELMDLNISIRMAEIR